MLTTFATLALLLPTAIPFDLAPGPVPATDPGPILRLELECLTEVADPAAVENEVARAIRLAADWLMGEHPQANEAGEEVVRAVARATAWLAKYESADPSEREAISRTLSAGVLWLGHELPGSGPVPLADGSDASDEPEAGAAVADGFRAADDLPLSQIPAGERVAASLSWLARHQASDGRWDAKDFATDNIVGPSTCDGAGSVSQDVGVTGLALLAFLADGNTLESGPYKHVVQSAVKWLSNQQDPETGLIGSPIGYAFHYDHGIAALALSEAYVFTRSPLLRARVELATKYIHVARNPYGAWRYDSPPVGDNDTSVTSWMVMALRSAEDAGVAVDREAFVGALGWIDQVSDPETGRIGYDSMGSVSSRIRGINDHMPASGGEAMTAAGLLLRVFLGQQPDQYEIMNKHADLLLTCLPDWDREDGVRDMYYWYYGSYAMFQMGGKYWKAWSESLKRVIQRAQRDDGDFKGSFDPVGPWGASGGRVYSTALMTLSMQVYYRYAKVIGSR